MNLDVSEKGDILVENGKIKEIKADISSCESCEIIDASGKMVIKGFANTSDKDRVGDVVLPSAFEKSLAEYLENPVEENPTLFEFIYKNNLYQLNEKMINKILFIKGEPKETSEVKIAEPKKEVPKVEKPKAKAPKKAFKGSTFSTKSKT